jgi:hypothetical protein
LDDIDCLFHFKFPVSSRIQYLERLLKRGPIEEAVGHGRPGGTGDRIKSGILFRSVISPCPRYTRSDRVRGINFKLRKAKTRLSLGTVYASLLSGDGMLKSLVKLKLDTSLSLLFLRTVSSGDPLSFSEVGSDGLWKRMTSGLVQMSAVRPANLSGEGFKWSCLDRVDRQLVVGVNGSETSRNLI